MLLLLKPACSIPDIIPYTILKNIIIIFNMSIIFYFFPYCKSTFNSIILFELIAERCGNVFDCYRKVATFPYPNFIEFNRPELVSLVQQRNLK